jgi:hypothetical protein
MEPKKFHHHKRHAHKDRAGIFNNANSHRSAERKTQSNQTHSRRTMKMTPEKINQAIAVEMVAAEIKKRGVLPVQRTDHSLLYGGADSFGLWIYANEEGEPWGMNYDSREDLIKCTIDEHAKRHNYFADLNACREMEEKAMQDLFNADEWSAYGKWLSDLHPTAVISPTSHTEDANDFYYEIASIAAASAPQRCEAFLRVKGKWVE